MEHAQGRLQTLLLKRLFLDSFQPSWTQCYLTYDGQRKLPGSERVCKKKKNISCMLLGCRCGSLGPTSRLAVLWMKVWTLRPPLVSSNLKYSLICKSSCSLETCSFFPKPTEFCCSRQAGAYMTWFLYHFLLSSETLSYQHLAYSVIIIIASRRLIPFLTLSSLIFHLEQKA